MSAHALRLHISLLFKASFFKVQSRRLEPSLDLNNLLCPHRPNLSQPSTHPSQPTLFYQPQQWSPKSASSSPLRFSQWLSRLASIGHKRKRQASTNSARQTPSTVATSHLQTTPRRPSSDQSSSSSSSSRSSSTASSRQRQDPHRDHF